MLVQFTALSWSRRGFPLKSLPVIGLFKYRGAKVALVFHDLFVFLGARLRDKVRRRVQIAVMLRSAGLIGVTCVMVPRPAANRPSWLWRAVVGTECLAWNLGFKALGGFLARQC